MRLGDNVEVYDAEDTYFCKGDFGVLIDIKDGKYLIEFRNIPATAWFDKNEIRVKGDDLS